MKAEPLFPPLASFLDRAAVSLATGFGLGFLPERLRPRLEGLRLNERWTGAGFLGALAGTGAAALFLPLSGWKGAATGLLLAALGTWSSHRAEAVLGKKDDARIIIDEIAGSVWSFLFLPESLLSGGFGIVYFAAGFALFRIFDVCKWPLPQAQNLPGGWGVMMDDLLAGALANLLLQGGARALLKT